MSGRLGEDSHGQLATLDAIVFFSAALLASSVILSYGLGAHEVTIAGACRDPGDLLEVFLGASVGEELVLDLPERTVIGSNERIGECLNLELCSVLAGTSGEAFLPLNQLLSEALDRLCGPMLHHRLVMLDSGSDEVLAMGPDVGADARDAYASSTVMRDVSGADYLLVLILAACAS